MILLIIILALTSIISEVSAQWSSDPTVNTQVAQEGLLPNMISDGSGGAYITYQNAPVIWKQTYIQRVNKFGYNVLPGDRILVSGPQSNQGNDILLENDGSGGVYIVFPNRVQVGEDVDVDVYAQHIDSTGMKLWGEEGIPVAPLSESSSLIDIISDGEGGIIVFWIENFGRHRREYIYEIYEFNV